MCETEIDGDKTKLEIYYTFQRTNQNGWVETAIK